MKHMAFLACAAALLAFFSPASPAAGSMIGIGREGDFAIEIFAERSEVERGIGTATVTLPREAETLFRAADIRQGDGVWTGDGTAGSAAASVKSLVPSWFSCAFHLDERVRSVPVPVERFHLLRWGDLGKRFATQLEGLAGADEAAWRDGLSDILGRARTVFGGRSMVTGFLETKYAAEFSNLQRVFDRCVRQGQMRGFSAGSSLKADYGTLFGTEWPGALLAVFFAGDDRAIEIRRITDAAGHALPDVFESPLPVRLEGTNSIAGVFPANTELRIAYAPADGGGGEEAGEQAFSWRSEGDGGTPVWFMLQPAPSGEGEEVRSTMLENAGSVAVAVKISIGEAERTHTLPVGERALLYVVVRSSGGDQQVQLSGEPDVSDPYAPDWTVSFQQEPGPTVRFYSARKAPPGLVLNNPEMMPVDVTVTPAGGGWGSSTKLTLQAGETGVGIPVPAHKTLIVGYRFRSNFHKAGHTEIPGLFYGDRSNLVLRAELKGDPEVAVRNTGPVAVRLSGMSGPSETVEIPAGQSAKVTVPSGRRTILSGIAVHADYQCEPVAVAAMEPGETTSVNLHMALKPAPQVVLRNAGGMMDVEATLMSGAGRPIAKPVTVKRGASSRPLVVPMQENLFFRLSYSNGRFTAQGRLSVPVIPRGETRTIDIPGPTSDIRLQQTSGSPAASAAPAAVRTVAPAPPSPAPAPAPVPATPVPAPAPAATAAPTAEASAPVILGP